MKQANQNQVTGEIVKTLKSDSIDSFMFQRLADKSENFQELTEKAEKPEQKGLVADAFCGLYRPEPQIDESAPALQQRIVSQMLEMSEFQQTHALTQGNDLLAGIATLEFAPALLEQFNRVQEKIQERVKKQQEAVERGEKPQPLPGQTVDKNGKPRGEPLPGDQDMAALRGALRKSLEQAQQKAEEAEQLLAGWGLEPGELDQTPVEEKLALVELLQKTGKLQKVGDLIGRFQNVVNQAVAQSPVHGTSEIVDIGIGNDLEHLLPSEIIKLSEQPDLFALDYIEGKLAVYNLRGEEQLGKGPIICCLDKSGSMGGRPDEWATAFVIGLMLLARKQKRAFGIILFNTRVEHQAFWPAGQAISIKEKIAIAQIGVGGGTNYMAALERAMAFRQEEKNLTPADFVVISDGLYGWNPDDLARVLKFKQDTATRCFGVFVNHTGETPADLEKFSDQLAVVGPDGSIEVVREVMKATASGLAKGIKR